MKKKISLLLVIMTLFVFVFSPVSSMAATSKSVNVSGSNNALINYTFTASATVTTGKGWSYFWGKQTQLHMKNEGRIGVIYRIYDKKGKVKQTGIINPGKVVHYYMTGNGAKFTVKFSLGTLTTGRKSSVFLWTSAGSVS